MAKTANEINTDSIKNIYDFTYQFSELRQLMLDLENNVSERDEIVAKIENLINLLKAAAKSINLRISLNEQYLDSLLNHDCEYFEEYNDQNRSTR